MNRPSQSWRYLYAGAVAGAVSAFGFAVIHDVFISDIWFSAVAMIVAGAVCGLSVGWSYGLLVPVPSTAGWVRYNLLYVGLFVLLGAASVVVFEPVTTIAALIEANEPPGELITRAMPMTAAFTHVAAVVVGRIYGRSWLDYGAILLTCTVLVLLLGLNISVIGLVYVPSGSVYLIAEMFGLIAAINAIYVSVFILLERKSLAAVRA